EPDAWRTRDPTLRGRTGASPGGGRRAGPRARGRHHTDGIDLELDVDGRPWQGPASNRPELRGFREGGTGRPRCEGPRGRRYGLWVTQLLAGRCGGRVRGGTRGRSCAEAEVAESCPSRRRAAIGPDGLAGAVRSCATLPRRSGLDPRSGGRRWQLRGTVRSLAGSRGQRGRLGDSRCVTYGARRRPGPGIRNISTWVSGL